MKVPGASTTSQSAERLAHRMRWLAGSVVYQATPANITGKIQTFHRYTGSNGRNELRFEACLRV